MASDHQIAAPSRTSARAKRPPITRQSDFLMVKHNSSPEDSTISNQHICSNTKSCPDVKPHPHQYTNVHSALKDSPNNLKVYHQNIRGLKKKISQLSNILHPEPIEYYKLGGKFCRRQYKNGGVCIYVHESIDYSCIPIHHICKEKDLEICAIKINLSKVKIAIITIYRSPTGDFSYFLKKPESFLIRLHTKKLEIIICGDININYLHRHNKKQLLDSLLASYNLKSVVDFPTRIFNG
jgi:hypothetical protein